MKKPSAKHVPLILVGLAWVVLLVVLATQQPSKRGPRNMHGRPISREIAIPMMIACTPATAAPAGSFSPMRRATIAVVERLNPSPTAKTRLSSDSVRPTVATASAPSRPTQNTSTTANSDSSTISRTIGIASSKMARLRLPVVKS